MANKEHLVLLDKGVTVWNNWRAQNQIIPDLSNACLKGKNLSGVNFSNADLRGVDLSNANLQSADLSGANLSNSDLPKVDLTDAYLPGANLSQTNLYDAILMGANFEGAKLSSAILSESKLYKANLRGTNLDNARLIHTDLMNADLSNAILTNAQFIESSLIAADLSNSDLSNAYLTATQCIGTVFNNANITNTRIYGISIWSIQSQGLIQNNLIITRDDESKIIVDDIEIAQFIYLILDNEKIRNVIGTLAKKAILILGRFTPERKKILDAIRERLREEGFVPIMFDFEKASSRDFTETIKILAGMSRFVIVDVTSPKSSPLELQATVPDYCIPFIPIKQKGEDSFSMLADFRKYDWFYGTVINYNSIEELMSGFRKGIIDKALSIEKRISKKKQDSIDNEDIENYKD